MSGQVSWAIEGQAEWCLPMNITDDLCVNRPTCLISTCRDSWIFTAPFVWPLEPWISELHANVWGMNTKQLTLLKCMYSRMTWCKRTSWKWMVTIGNWPRNRGLNWTKFVLIVSKLMINAGVRGGWDWLCGTMTFSHCLFVSWDCRLMWQHT